MKDIPENSVVVPLTNSDSASAKSNGTRPVEIHIVIKYENTTST